MRYFGSATALTFLATVSFNAVFGQETSSPFFVSHDNSTTLYTGNELLQDLDRGLTPHFVNWLNNNGYGHWEFERLDLVGGAYGGKSSDTDNLNHAPIVFFHGNSDIAVGT
jgi:hypothetical protein